ncbi:MAG: M1 family aminopeptidase [Candidatus Kryptoniota bacterium]
MQKKFIVLFVLLYFIGSSAAQPQGMERGLPPIHHAPDREFHMINVDLHLKFDLFRKKVYGSAVETIVPLRVDYDSVRLDAVDMRIEKVSMGDRILSFTYDGKKLVIGLDRKYSPDDTLTYTVVYSTVPRKGIFFVLPDTAYPERVPQIWSQSEMEDARNWFPCHDYPDDFVKSSVTATVPDDWVVVSNGVLKKVEEHSASRTKTFQWVEDKPHVVYLISIVAGKYSIVKDRFDEIPIYYYVPSVDRENARENFSHTPDILKFYSNVTGYRYPWQKLSLAAVSDFTYGGMENVSAITLTDATIHSANAEPQISSTGLIAHEIAHQWFGDLLTCRTWSNAWLNEGFATYFEALYGKHAFGDDHFSFEMYNDQKQVLNADKLERRPTVYNRYYNAVDLFGPYIYARGADILNMLRGVIGDKLFYKAIKYYVHKFCHQNVDTHDFENAVREATGYNLYWFFDEWVYKAGHPVFDVSYKYDSTAHRVFLKVKQTQTVDSLTPVYKMPVDVYIVTPSEKVIEKVWVDSTLNSYAFSVPEKPLMVNFDEGNYLLKEIKFQKSADELGYQLMHDPDAAGRIWAASQLSKCKGQGAVKALSNGALNDKFWAVRVECLNSLKNFSDLSVEQVFKAALRDKDQRVQVAAIDALAKLKAVSAKDLFKDLFERSSNYYVKAAAVKALAEVTGRSAMPFIERALKLSSHQEVIRGAALAALEKVDSSKAYEYAVRFARYGMPPSLRLQAIGALSRLGPANEKTISLLKEYASDPYIWARLAAITSLGKVGETDVIPLLKLREEEEADGRLKEAAKQAIWMIEMRQKSAGKGD